MGQVIGEYLPMAIFVAISPIPIVGVILMLFTEQARSDSLAFLAGWIVGSTVAIITLGYAILGTRIQPALDDTKTWLTVHNTAIMAVLLLVIGAALFGKGLGALTNG